MDLDCYEMLMLPPRAQELMRFACSRMVHSYKPVLVRIFLDRLAALSFLFADVARDFVAFYGDREARGLPIERRGSWFIASRRVDEERCAAVAHGAIRNGLDRYHGYASADRGEVRLGHPGAWQQLQEPANRDIADQLLARALTAFFDRITTSGQAVYARSAGFRDAGEQPDLRLLVDEAEGEGLLGAR
jgi:hypothetical protein